MGFKYLIYTHLLTYKYNNHVSISKKCTDIAEDRVNISKQRKKEEERSESIGRVFSIIKKLMVIDILSTDPKMRKKWLFKTLGLGSSKLMVLKCFFTLLLVGWLVG